MFCIVVDVVPSCIDVLANESVVIYGMTIILAAKRIIIKIIENIKL